MCFTGVLSLLSVAFAMVFVVLEKTCGSLVYLFGKCRFVNSDVELSLELRFRKEMTKLHRGSNSHHLQPCTFALESDLVVEKVRLVRHERGFGHCGGAVETGWTEYLLYCTTVHCQYALSKLATSNKHGGSEER